MGKEGRSLPVHRDGKFCYEIRLEQDFERLPECVEALGVRGRRLCIVTDSHAGLLYAEAVREKLAKVFGKVTVWTVEAGEENKTLDTVRALYEHLILEHFDRKDMLAALGGGVIGDLTGFAAATYLLTKQSARRGLFLIGARSSGKTNYITVLIDQLRKNGGKIGQNLGVLASTVADNNEDCTQYRYQENFYKVLFKNGY